MKTKYANIAAWCDVLRATKHKTPQPVLAFPVVQTLGQTVDNLVHKPDLQAMGIKLMTERYDMPIALGYMDLSVEAEAFGSETIYSAEEVPTIRGAIVTTEEEADALEIPEIGAGRTGVYLKGIELALKIIDDRPVFGECIGPFSLAGRLVDVNEAMVLCYEEPEMMETVLEKATTFIINYINAYKEIGAHGIMMAEPLAGMLSPHLAEEFSAKYVKRIVEATQDENFVIFYHNCGNDTIPQAESIFSTGCKGYHFGDGIDMEKMLEIAPKDALIMGNVSPSECFFNGTRKMVRQATLNLMHKCFKFDNFWLSSGCDIPPMTDFGLIDEFFQSAEDFYHCDNLYEKIMKVQ